MESQNISEHRTAQKSNKAHVLLFTSGKRGVGKTYIVANVASAMAHKGAKVCIFDADTGSHTIANRLGMSAEFTLEHVLSGEKAIADIALTTENGIALIPGAGGIGEHMAFGERRTTRLSAALSELDVQYDFILIDSGSGFTDNALRLIDSAPCTFLIITPDPSSLSDTFSLLKRLNFNHRNGRIRAVVNQATDYTTAIETYRRFSTTVQKYLQLNIEYGGFVAYDFNAPITLPLHLQTGQQGISSPTHRCLTALADNILKFIGSEQANSGLTDYWHKGQTEDDTITKTTGDLPPAPPELTPETTSSTDDLLQQLLAEIKTRPPNREHQESFIGQFVSLFVDQHGAFPQSFKQLFYRWLEAENYAAPRLMELVTTLESLYTTRYRQPLFNLEDSAARLIAQTQDSESKLRDLIFQLHAAYRQSFQTDMFDARQEILRTIQQEDFTEERFEELLQTLQAGFQARFNRPYQGQSALLLESTAEALLEMADEEINLQNEILRLSQSFQQLTSRREALLSAIESAQSTGLTIKPIGSIEAPQE